MDTPLPPPFAAAYGTESELVAGLLANEVTAWRVFERLYATMLDYCIRRALRNARHLGDDAVVEVRANVYVDLLASDRAKLRSWRASGGSRFSTWVTMIAIQAAHGYLRSTKREALREDLSTTIELESVDLDPYQVASRGEILERARAKMNAFKPRDRKFAQLYFIEGLEPEAIAQRLGLSINTVYSKRFKIQERLLAAFNLDETSEVDTG